MKHKINNKKKQVQVEGEAGMKDIQKNIQVQKEGLGRVWDNLRFEIQEENILKSQVVRGRGARRGGGSGGEGALKKIIKYKEWE